VRLKIGGRKGARIRRDIVVACYVEVVVLRRTAEKWMVYRSKAKIRGSLSGSEFITFVCEVGEM